MRIRRILLMCCLALPASADEGMWLFNQFPKDKVKEKYSFEVTDSFLEPLRLASVRLGDGAVSGAFVAPGGLLVSSRRPVAECLAKAGRDDFYAAAQPDELPCPGLEAGVLLAIEDVTAQVKEAGREGAPAAEVLQQRNAAIARIEKACAQKTGNTCSVVSLSSGERYDLYHYKQYTDMRLVFAPESAIALFGGDAANYSFQRYSLDFAFLRAYENGKPAATPHFLKWSIEPPADGAPVFTVGSPRATARLATAAQLAFYRDTQLPAELSRIQSRIEDLRAFANKSAENVAVAQRALREFNNSYKLTAGRLIGLRDERLMLRKQTFEKRLRAAVEHDPKLGTEAAKVWDDVAAAYKSWAASEKPFQLLERPGAQGSNLFRIARQIVRLGAERGKPNEQRLAEYRDSALPALELSVYAPAPIDDSAEVVVLARYLDELKALGDKEAPVKSILAGKTPQQAAEALVAGSKLKDIAERKRLLADPAALSKSEDAMIRLARLLDEPARKLLKKREETIESLEVSAAGKIAQYRFRVFGPADYPDSTSTPRVSFGAIKAYKDKTEAPVLSDTTFGGLFYRAGPQAATLLPKRWLDAKPTLQLATPMNFVSTCDIGGNSGAPSVNAKGEIIGVVFDGNLEAISLTYLYMEDQARAVHMSTEGIVEALRKVYKTPQLLRELGVPEAKDGPLSAGRGSVIQ